MRRIPGRNLWLGHAGDARDRAGLFGAGIEALVDLARDELPSPTDREWTYCRFPLVDGGGNPPWLLRMAVGTVADLVRAEVPTLVYCGAGLSRTPAVAGAALALVLGCDPSQGLALVARERGADVAPSLWSEIRAAIGAVA